MKLLFVYLVILNLLYAGWEYLRPSHQLQPLPAIESGLASLVLLHEQKTVGKAKQPVVDDEDKDVAENTASELDTQSESRPVCYTLGPFKDKNILKRASESLAEQVDEVSVRKLQQSEKHRYWVYIPAVESRSAAKKMAAELKAKNISDFYIVLRGSEKNSISLGHFKEPAFASRRMKMLTDLGFNATIEVIYREYDVYWLDYRYSGSGDEQMLSAENSLADGISRISRACSNADN